MSQKKPVLLVPSLRFPAFKNDPPWTLKTLGEVVNYESSTIHLNEITLKNTGFPLYGASGFVGFLDTYQMPVDYISIIKDGASVGKVNYRNKKSSVLGTLGYIKPKDSSNNLKFIYYFLSRVKFECYRKGTTIPHVYFKDYSQEITPIPPSLLEQEKIADCLSSFDDLISLNQKKLDSLQKHKKALIQKLFPALDPSKKYDPSEKIFPSLRFPAFKNDPPWTLKTLGEVVNYESSPILLKKVILKNTGFPLYGASGFVGFLDTYQMPVDYISIVKFGASVGKVNYRNKKSSVLGTFGYIKIKDSSDNLKFIYYFLSRVKFDRYREVTTVPNIYFKDYSQETTPIPPSLKEQEKIADCLSSFDDLISLNQKKLDSLQQHKKALIQQLFPTINKGDN